MSNQLSGRCLNIGNCDVANSMSTVQVDEGSEFVCSECGKPLVASQTTGKSNNKVLRNTLLSFGVVTGLAAGAFGVTSILKSNTSNSPESGLSVSSNAQANGNEILRLAGSNTLGSKLIPALVEEYFKTKGCSDVAIQKVEIEFVRVTCKLDGKDYFASVKFKGSATAFTGLKDGTADIGMASRRAKPAEVASLAGLSNLTSPTNEHVIALDGIAIIVSPSNQVPRLSIPQVRQIFTGAISSFSSVGGPSTSVSIYRRDDKSGTFDSFKSLVLHDDPISSSAKDFEDSNELSAAVAADNKGIGFVGHTFIGGAHAIPIGAPGQIALLPNRFTIQTEDYPLSRRLYLYTTSEGGNAEASKFVSFVNSRSGQAVVEKQNFVPLEIVSQRAAAPSNTSNAYQKVTEGAERLSVNFRFNSGSNQLDNRALADLDRVTEYLIRTSTPPSKLVLIGFADNVGDPSSNILLSKDRAQTVAKSLNSRGIAPRVITGFGSENPIASNSSPEGQQKNRRVEVWVSK